MGRSAITRTQSLVHQGKHHELVFARRLDKAEWAISLDGEAWATGKRIEHRNWLVRADNLQQQGYTLEQATYDLFYKSRI